MIRRRRKLFGSLLPKPTGTRQSQTFKVMNLFCATTWIGALVALSFRTLAANAQGLSLTANDDVCGCTSGSYTFELDFELTCPPTNIHIGSGTGVERVSCLISPFGAPATDLEPISVESISILELDQSNSVLVEKSLEGEFFSGFSFSYTSIINEATSVQGIPKSLQMNLSGKNADGVMLMNVFVITFTNECGVMPVIQAGESAGWVTFVSSLLGNSDIYANIFIVIFSISNSNLTRLLYEWIEPNEWTDSKALSNTRTVVDPIEYSNNVGTDHNSNS